jgi:hypothetical protein
MTRQVLGHRIPALASSVLVSLVSILFVVTAAFAQAVGEKFSDVEPELANFIDAAYIAQAAMFSGISAIDNSPETADARNEFAGSLQMRANMSMAQMMAMMKTDTGMQMPGPFDEQESSVSSEMMGLLRTRPLRRDIEAAYEASSLPSQAVEVIRRGRSFESRIYEIFADSSVSDKTAALADALATYVSAGLSVPAQPKPATLLLDHPYAGAFVDGYPKLSSVLWSTQWLRLATIEAMILQEQDTYYWGSLETVRERFESKIVDSARSPLPVELPRAPAIAPTLFTLNAEASIVLDNLSMFETVLADILTYPNLEDKSALVDLLVEEFTNHAGNFDPTIDYVVSALRGGIYNQGGPAIGELSQSERNQSRMEMGMQHAMIMGTP